MEGEGRARASLPAPLARPQGQPLWREEGGPGSDRSRAALQNRAPDPAAPSPRATWLAPLLPAPAQPLSTSPPGALAQAWRPCSLPLHCPGNSHAARWGFQCRASQGSGTRHPGKRAPWTPGPCRPLRPHRRRGFRASPSSSVLMVQALEPALFQLWPPFPVASPVSPKHDFLWGPLQPPAYSTPTMRAKRGLCLDGPWRAHTLQPTP